MIGKRLHNYKIESLIDQGGMGSVYLGVHMHLGRRVAIKSLHPSLTQKPEIRERFKSEAITLSKLQHPNIEALYDYIESPEGVFIILEYIEGITLEEYIEKESGPIPEQKAIKLFIKILDAVAYIHSMNIIHRDIKPGNFIITPDFDVKILDFGIAKILSEADKNLTKIGTKVGTTLYMSPQQVKGQMLDRRTDIYSLGVVLFQIVTGQYPYDKNETDYEIYNHIINEPLPNAKEFYRGVSDRMQDIIAKATSKRPLDRFQSCEEFSASLMGMQDIIDQPSLSLKTKLLEFNDLKSKAQVFSNSTLRNLLLILITSVFWTALAIAIYNTQKEDIRHIIADKTFLNTGDSINSEKVEILNYGETVRVLGNKKTSQKDGWYHVMSLRGNVGYVYKEDIASPKFYQQINSIFGNISAQAQTPVFYKWALRKYFVENQYYNKLNPEWKIQAEEKTAIEFSTIVHADFNNNGINDYACVLLNNKNLKSKLLIIFDSQNENVLIEFPEKVKIKSILKGKDGGGWYLGNQLIKTGSNGKEYKVNKYEYLPSDGLLLFKPETKQNIIYFYNSEENMINFFLQP